VHITNIISFVPGSHYAPFFCNRLLQIYKHLYPSFALHILFYWLLLLSVYLGIILLRCFFFLVFVFLPLVSLCTDLIMQYFILEVFKLNTHNFSHLCTCRLITRTPVWSVCLCTGLSDIRLRDVMQSFFSYYFTATVFRYLPLLGSGMTCKDDPQVRVLCERNECTFFLFSS
jgi:hypothetical protein